MKVPIEIITNDDGIVVQIVGTECWLNYFKFQETAKSFVNDLVETGYFELREEAR